MKYTKISVFIPNIKPPFFMGSQLRGAFGYGLKKVVCINPSFKCDGCFATNNCVYYDFYERKNIFHKYRFDFGLNQDKYNYNLYLFNETTKELPYILSAIHQTITKFGFGVERKTYDFFTIKVNDKLVYDGENFNIPKNNIIEFINNDYKQDFILKIITPIRMKKDSKLAISIELEDIIRSIYHRELSLSGFEIKKIPFEVKAEVTKQLKWKKLTRYSNRQNTKMKIDGVIGEMRIKNIDEKSYRYLKLGEIIGVGKLTTFGLGKIEIKDVK